ncbi:hypothetical protein Ddye_025438 [Dipteronia dyeriana]|uniref:Reverse transcriptase domain-containing protein n=1 Tax=Dipteronia dyeriana TaxID=168575 RepID=A0AAD9TL67_9ROSI|nr:hypothetical protein Ddye_025438 [Dipteronia dyeriana]
MAYKSKMKQWIAEGKKIISAFEDLETKLAEVYAKANQGRFKNYSGLINKKFLAEEKTELEKKFSEKEVREALSNCDGNKAPGPKDSSIIKDLNATFIALIPKIRNPVSLNDYRPISLVSSLYKLLAKVLAVHLKKVMNSIIGDSKKWPSLKNRQITDSFVIASEIIHKWRKDSVWGIFVKLDFKKAYDCVNHSFLLSMLKNMGFGARWID